jgi:hypothetical protein
MSAEPHGRPVGDRRRIADPQPGDELVGEWSKQKMLEMDEAYKRAVRRERGELLPASPTAENGGTPDPMRPADNPPPPTGGNGRRRSARVEAKVRNGRKNRRRRRRPAHVDANRGPLGQTLRDQRDREPGKGWPARAMPGSAAA